MTFDLRSEPVTKPVPDRRDQFRIGLDLLAKDVPLTLIIDLASRVDSHEVYAQEGTSTVVLPDAG
jgi:hypothetical protein